MTSTFFFSCYLISLIVKFHSSIYRTAWLLLISINPWWDQVTVTPEANKIAVLSKGIWRGLKGWTPKGGQLPPISKVGAKLLWKNAQKKDKKKKISDTINNNIPHPWSPSGTVFTISSEYKQKGLARLEDY